MLKLNIEESKSSSLVYKSPRVLLYIIRSDRLPNVVPYFD
jgi:hypothetical protein